MSNLDNLGNDLDSDRVFICARALIGNAWVCAPKHMTLEQVQIAVDVQCEPYIPEMRGEPATPWTVTPREHEDETLVSPGRCVECDDRQHWFMLGGMTGVVLAAMTDSSGFPPDLEIRQPTPKAEGSA